MCRQGRCRPLLRVAVPGPGRAPRSLSWGEACLQPACGLGRAASAPGAGRGPQASPARAGRRTASRPPLRRPPSPEHAGRRGWPPVWSRLCVQHSVGVPATAPRKQKLVFFVTRKGSVASISLLSASLYAVAWNHMYSLRKKVICKSEKWTDNCNPRWCVI